MGDAFLDADQIRVASFVRHVEIHDSLGSTNDRAAELAREPNIQLPALVVARHQTAGRGRGRNTWWSANGALTFSVLLEPAALGISTANWPQLSLATAVAVCDALQIELTTGQRAGASSPPVRVEDEPARSNQKPRLGIKWPNDVFLNGGKVCGILIESPGGVAPTKDRLIIGIGINVNNSRLSAPSDAGPNMATLCDVIGQRHELQLMLTAVLKAMSGRIDQLRERDPILIQAWQQLDLLAGLNVTVETDGRRIEGECVVIAHDGALVVDTSSAHQRFYSGSASIKNE